MKGNKVIVVIAIKDDQLLGYHDKFYYYSKNFECQKSKSFETGVTHFIGYNVISENTTIYLN